MDKNTTVFLVTFMIGTHVLTFMAGIDFGLRMFADESLAAPPPAATATAYSRHAPVDDDGVKGL
jgi:hypothetical protein